MPLPHEQEQANTIILAAIASMGKKLSSIEAKLEKKVAYLSVEDAVNGYLKYLREGLSRRGKAFRQPRHFFYLLDKLAEYFTDKRNVVELTPEELDEFVYATWGNSNTNTIKQRKTQLKSFFNWCARELQRKGSPSFHNPCNLLEPVPTKMEQFDYFPVETMRRLLRITPPRYYLAFAIMATAGLRISEVIALRKKHIAGRIITIILPKSGKQRETAVIPWKIAKKIEQHFQDSSSEDCMIRVTDRTMLTAIHNIGNKLGLKLTNHSLRKWCISYWSRKEDYAMEDFVSRHSATSLRDRYVAPLSPEEAIEHQTIMEKELFG